MLCYHCFVECQPPQKMSSRHATDPQLPHQNLPRLVCRPRAVRLFVCFSLGPHSNVARTLSQCSSLGTPPGKARQPRMSSAEVSHCSNAISTAYSGKRTSTSQCNSCFQWLPYSPFVRRSRGCPTMAILRKLRCDHGSTSCVASHSYVLAHDLYVQGQSEACATQECGRLALAL